MRFLIDNQLPLLLAQHLHKHGHDCEHVLDADLADANDLTVWEYALRHERVVVSKDEDFVFLAGRSNDSGRLVWVRLGNCRNHALLNAFDAVHDHIVQALQSGQRVIELR